MDTLTVSVLLAAFGLISGSFAGAQVWRLRARQLREDKSAGEKVSANEYGQLKGLLRPVAQDRSECLHCHHVLHWYDMLPLFSWVSLGGKCRYCRRPIGWMEPLIELGLATVFVCSYLFWPYALSSGLDWVRFAVWLIACVLMAILFIYDARWSLLPFAINISLVCLGVLFLALSMIITPFAGGDWLSLLGGLAILAGLYYLFSIPGWVGLGDSILGVALALLLLQWERAFMVLFLANLLGCLMLVPLLFRRKLARGAQIPFGPFLIVATWITVLWGSALIAAAFNWSGLLLNPFMV